MTLQHYPHKNPHTPKYSFFWKKTLKIIQIQNIDAQIMAKPMCTYKYQSTPKRVFTCTGGGRL